MFKTRRPSGRLWAVLVLVCTIVTASAASADDPKPKVLHVRLPDVGNQHLFGPQVLFSADGRWLSVAGNLIDLKTAKYVGNMQIVAFSPDSKLAVTGGVRPKLWALPETPEPKGVNWNKYDDKSMDSVLNCKRVDDGRLRLGESLDACCFSSDGKLIGLASGDGRLRLFDVASGERKGVALVGTNIKGLRLLSSETAKVAAWSQIARGGIKVWDGESATPVALKEPAVMKGYSNDKRNSLGYSPDGRWLVEAARPPNGLPNHLFVYDLKSGTVKDHPHPSASAVAWHPDGKGLFVGYEDGSVGYFRSGAAGLIDGSGIGEGRVLLRCVSRGTGPRDREVRAVGVSGDATCVAAVDVGGSVAIFKHGGWESQTAFTPDLFPTAVGTTWMYTVTPPKGGKKRQDVRLMGLEVFGDRLTMAMEVGHDQLYASQGIDGRSVTMYKSYSEHWDVREDGLYLMAKEGKPVRTSKALTYFGLKPGETLGDKRQGKGPLVKGLGEEEVEVPSGKYKATKARVTAYGSTGDPVSEETTWYVRGVGLVKRILNNADGIVTIELERFERGPATPRPDPKGR